MTQTSALVIVTGNPAKAQVIQAAIERPTTHIKLDLPEIQSVDVREVIEHKARGAYQAVGKPVLVEDTGLFVKAWNGLPGALVKWFLHTVGNDGICKMLASYDQLDAVAEACLGYFDGENFVAFSGVIEGSIARQPRGQGGFGWDPIFIPNGWEKTFAELTPEESQLVSMRRLAWAKLKVYLDERGL